MGFLTDWLTDWIKGLLIEGILNNGPAPVLPPEEKPLDKVREIPPKRRSREREER